MIKAKLIIGALILAAVISSGGWIVAQSPTAIPPSHIVRAEKFLRTELYFGKSKADGTIVLAEDWNRFLAEVVTPRFPGGFTVLTANGQYRDKIGRIVSEPAEVIVFLYSRQTKKVSRTKIEEIRSAYLKQFDQESVLRVDFPKSVNVSF